MIAATWTHHTVDFSTAGDALVTSPNADPDTVGPTGWQASMRRDGAGTIVLGIEPSGSIDGAGTTGAAPTSTSADWSGETSSTAGAPTPPDWHGFNLNAVIGAGTKYELVEGVDFWQLLITKPTPSEAFYALALQIGKIYNPPEAEDPGNGRDGLGWLCGRPDAPTPSVGADEFLNNNSVNTYSGVLHSKTNNWVAAGLNAVPVVSGGSLDPDWKPPSYDAKGRYNRLTNANQDMGKYKYVRHWHSSKAAKTRQDSAGADEQSWIHVDDTGSTNLLLPWVKTGGVPA
jgi:hypothetical protein